MVVTTRRLDDLRAECAKHDIAYLLEDGREMLMDRLRAKLGSFDTTTEVDPMKAQETKSLIKLGPEGPDYSGLSHLMGEKFAFEPKLDGCRMRMFIGLTGATLNTGRRNVKNFQYTDRTANFPHLAEVCGEDLTGVILDGEILAPAAKIQTHTGTWTNSLLNASVALTNAKPAGSIATQERFGKAIYWVFDILSYEGKSIQALPYHQRRVLLEMVVNTIHTLFPSCEIKLIPQLPPTEESIRQAMLDGFEGVVIKGLETPYLPGKRKGWWKVKTFSTADGFVCDWIPGENRNTGLVGSLELAVVVKEVPSPIAQEVAEGEFLQRFEPEGKAYLCRKVAQVGNLTDDMRVAVTNAGGGLKPNFYGTVVEFVGQGMSKNGRVRHGHMVRLRPDKVPVDCDLSQLSIFPPC